MNNPDPTSVANESAELREAMVSGLAAYTSLANPAVLDAMRVIPREVFVPSYFLDAGDSFRLLRGEAGSKDWLVHAYGDQSLATQLDSSVHADTADADAQAWQGAPTCSASQPSLVARMLDMLGVFEPGARVLEIGTGTGYNAALLCELSGSSNVFSIEYDPLLAAKARDHLAAIGREPTVAVGDGGLGLPEAGPFDAIITTCSFPAIHIAWLEQLAPEGVAVVNLITGIPVGILAVLTLNEPGDVAGRVVSQRAQFMATRTRPTNHALALNDRASMAGATTRPTELRWTDVEAADGLYVLTAFLLDAHLLISFTDDGGKQCGLFTDDGSAAIQEGGHVRESGPRRLWSELEEIAGQWARLGQPDRDELELSIRFETGVAAPTVIHPRSGWTAPANGINADKPTS
jgi:protein-L-isoaspartate(D-aspartate) O-methyltransferase